MSTVAGGGGAAAGDGEGVSPQGNFVNMVQNSEPRSRPELMQAALQTLEQSRATQAPSARQVPGKDDRTAWANDTWLKMYAILDYVRCILSVSVICRVVRGAVDSPLPLGCIAEPRPRAAYERNHQGNSDGQACVENVRRDAVACQPAGKG